MKRLLIALLISLPVSAQSLEDTAKPTVDAVCSSIKLDGCYDRLNSFIENLVSTGALYSNKGIPADEVYTADLDKWLDEQMKNKK